MPTDSDRFSRPSAAEDAGPGATDAESRLDESSTSAGPAAFGRLEQQLQELVEFVACYLAALLDMQGAQLRRVAVILAAAMLALAVVAGVLVTCTVIGILGIAELVSSGLGDRPWAGKLITGFGLLLAIAVSLVVAVAGMNRRFRERTVRKYVRRSEQQKARFGHDAADQAAAARRRAGQ